MLLPLDRRRRLRTDVQGYSVHRRDLVDDPARDRLEQVVGQARPVSRHRVLRRHRPDHDRVRVRPLVALHADRADRGQDCEALPQLAVQARAPDLLLEDRVRLAEDLEPLVRDLPDDPDREPGPRERLAPDHPLGQAELGAYAPHLVLEQKPERLDELHLHVLGQTADGVVRLGLGRDAVLAPARFDHIRVERPLAEIADVAQPPRLGLEHADELLADAPALLLGIGHAVEPLEESLLGVDVDERDVEVTPERLDYLDGLVLAEQAVIDEDTGELVADRLVHEQRRYGRVDAAGERTEHELTSHLLPNTLDLLLDHRRRRPGRWRVGDRVQEVLQQVGAVRRVDDLRMELDAVETSLGMLEGGDRGRGRGGGHLRAHRRLDDRVAVAHPHRLLAGNSLEERAAPELLSHQLHPVADAERGDAELEQLRIDTRRAFRVHRRRAAAQDQRERVARANPIRSNGVPDQLRIDAAFAHPPRDQLRVLPAEVDDEHRPFFGRLLRDRERDDLAHAR